MPREHAPLFVSFADLFDRLGTDDLRYSDAAQTLSGCGVAIEGFLSHAHGPRGTMLLVDQPGLCPDCSPSPAAAITVCGAFPFPQEGDTRPVRVTGRLDYGFRIDDGVASILRIEEAAVFPAATRAAENCA
jgi:hypothetical protein